MDLRRLSRHCKGSSIQLQFLCQSCYRNIPVANPEVLRDGSVKSWVFATLNAGLTVSEYLAMHDDILLEEMSHNDYLEPIIDAILKRVHIVFSYNRDETASKDDTDIEPYCIKLFEHHWYVVGHLPQKDFSSESFAVFDFDCIEDLKMTDRKFRRWKDLMLAYSSLIASALT